MIYEVRKLFNKSIYIYIYKTHALVESIDVDSFIWILLSRKETRGFRHVRI